MTIGPGAVSSAVHDRVPAILPPEDYEAWLSPKAPGEEAKALLRPYDGAMIAYPVS